MCSSLPLEICVDSCDGLAAAIAGGADRIELCSALSEGGLTPGPGLIMAAAGCPLPSHAMVRPRGGDFVLRPGDFQAMLGDIACVKSAGLTGVVIGVAKDNGALDRDALSGLIDAAGGLHVTLHRVFDLTPDPMAALDTAIDLGIQRILTSGQAMSADKGADLLARLVAHAQGHIEIMAGGGVTVANAPDLIACGVNALHASCRIADVDHAPCERIGISQRRRTDATCVSALKSAMKSGAQTGQKSPLTETGKVCA